MSAQRVTSPGEKVISIHSKVLRISEECRDHVHRFLVIGNACSTLALTEAGQERLGQAAAVTMATLLQGEGEKGSCFFRGVGQRCSGPDVS